VFFFVLFLSLTQIVGIITPNFCFIILNSARFLALKLIVQCCVCYRILNDII
jgi:hypothetical protein